VRPKIFTELSDVELRQRVEAELKAREDALIAERRKNGRPVVGMKAVKKQKCWMCPASTEDMFKTTPSVSARSKWVRIEALAEHAEFLAAYRQAWDAFVAGARDVVFPFGTWLMRTRFGFPCHTGP
jgi:hypothetical protein